MMMNHEIGLALFGRELASALPENLFCSFDLNGNNGGSPLSGLSTDEPGNPFPGNGGFDPIVVGPTDSTIRRIISEG
jgi:hypothetical protein